MCPPEDDAVFTPLVTASEDDIRSLRAEMLKEQFAELHEKLVLQETEAPACAVKEEETQSDVVNFAVQCRKAKQRATRIKRRQTQVRNRWGDIASVGGSDADTYEDDTRTFVAGHCNHWKPKVASLLVNAVEVNKAPAGGSPRSPAEIFTPYSLRSRRLKSQRMAGSLSKLACCSGAAARSLRSS